METPTPDNPGMLTKIACWIEALQCEVTLVTRLDGRMQLYDILSHAAREYAGTVAGQWAANLILDNKTGGMAMCSALSNCAIIYCPDPREWTSVFIHELRHAVDHILDHMGIPLDSEAAATVMETTHRALWTPMAKTMKIVEGEA